MKLNTDIWRYKAGLELYLYKIGYVLVGVGLFNLLIKIKVMLITINVFLVFIGTLIIMSRRRYHKEEKFRKEVHEKRMMKDVNTRKEK